MVFDCDFDVIGIDRFTKEYKLLFGLKYTS